MKPRPVDKYYDMLDEYVTSMVINYQKEYCGEIAKLLEYPNSNAEYIMRNHGNYLVLLYDKIQKWKEKWLRIKKSTLERNWKELLYLEHSNDRTLRS